MRFTLSLTALSRYAPKTPRLYLKDVGTVPSAGGIYASFSWETDHVGVESRSGATVFQCAWSDFVARALTVIENDEY